MNRLGNIAAGLAFAAAGFGATAARAAVIEIEAGAPTVNVATFDTASDVYNIFADTFGVAGALAFQNVRANDGNVSDLVNVIVLQNADNDDNPATVFNARTAATVIANNTGFDRSGFFVYFNSALNINRLVFSANLNDALAALTILAANLAPTGLDAIAQLPTFSEDNFEFSEIPLPAAFPLFAGALAIAGIALRRRKAS